MKYRRRLPLVSLVATLAMLAGACGQPASTAGPARSAAPSTAAAPAAGGSSGAASAGGSKQLTTVTIGSSNTSVTYEYLFLARDLGLFRKHGLQLRLVPLAGDRVAIPALANGKVEFFTGIGGATSGAATGLPIRIVYVALDHSLLYLVGRPGITAVNQLHGRTISSNDPGSNITAQAIAILQKHGLKTGDYKVSYTSAGSDTTQVAALTSGKVDAAMVNVGFALPLEGKGYHLLASAERDGPEVPNAGLATTVSMLQQHPQVVAATVRTMMDAVNILADPSQRSRVIPYLMKDLKISRQLAGETFDQVRPAWDTSGQPSAAALHFEASYLQRIDKLAAPPDMSRLYDLGPVRAASGASSG